MRAACLALALGACAGTQQGADNRGLDMTLTDEQGRSLQLAELRGRPVLLFLFATYDPPSQLALTQLLAATQGETRITIVGVAVQPDASSFLGPFREALEVPFALYFDKDEALLHGKTSLGKLPGVPAFVALDAEGEVQRTFFGVAKRGDLETLIDSAE